MDGKNRLLKRKLIDANHDQVKPNKRQLILVQPQGNLWFKPKVDHDINLRSQGLGNLSRLTDEILLSNLFTLLNQRDLMTLAILSKTLFIWSSIEGIWKALYIAQTGGRLTTWAGGWKATYLQTFFPSTSTPSLPCHDDISLPPPPPRILYSDVLFQPHLAASFDPNSIFHSTRFKESIPRLDGRNLTPLTLPLSPVILTHLMTDWPAFSSPTRHWSLEKLKSRFSTTSFRAEAALTTLPVYATYESDCVLDESPLYLFESDFVEKTASQGEFGLGDDYTVPACFQEDLFGVMGDRRPDYRWLIRGPIRSGSTFHKDPNSTSAWNAVVTGSKGWIMFPPDIIPPGVFVSEDLAEVSSPHSLAEWFLSYYKAAHLLYGPNAKDKKNRGKMLEGICRAGEVFFVPSGWWHIVVNLEASTAVTQNFVSRRELPAVLRFMKDRPEQVSGFKSSPRTDSAVATGVEECDEVIEGIFESFCQSLEQERSDCSSIIAEVVNSSATVSKKASGMWEKVKGIEEDEQGFSFGFFEEDEETVEL